MRVVLDTNILISACWKPGGLEAQVVAMGLNGTFTMAVSPELLAEYEEVLRRPKFSKLSSRVEELLEKLIPRLLLVYPSMCLDLATDPDDNRILECASEAAASFVITGNLRHYPLDWPVARILNARQFLDQLA